MDLTDCGNCAHSRLCACNQSNQVNQFFITKYATCFPLLFSNAINPKTHCCMDLCMNCQITEKSQNNKYANQLMQILKTLTNFVSAYLWHIRSEWRTEIIIFLTNQWRYSQKQWTLDTYAFNKLVLCIRMYVCVHFFKAQRLYFYSFITDCQCFSCINIKKHKLTCFLHFWKLY